MQQARGIFSTAICTSGSAALTGNTAQLTTRLSDGAHELSTRYDGDSEHRSTSSRIVTVVSMADTAPPLIAPNLLPAMPDYTDDAWYRQPVEPHWTIADAESKPQITQGGEEGLQVQDMNRAFTCTATSVGGSHTETHWLHIDRTPPEITGVPTVVIGITADANGIALRFEQLKASNKLSGIMWFNCSANRGTVFPVGETTVTCQANERVGNITKASFPAIVRSLNL